MAAQATVEVYKRRLNQALLEKDRALQDNARLRRELAQARVVATISLSTAIRAVHQNGIIPVPPQPQMPLISSSDDESPSPSL